MAEGTSVGSVYLDFVVRDTITQQVQDMSRRAADQTQKAFDRMGKDAAGSIQHTFGGAYNKTLETAKSKVEQLRTQYAKLEDQFVDLQKSFSGATFGPGADEQQLQMALDSSAGQKIVAQQDAIAEKLRQAQERLRIETEAAAAKAEAAQIRAQERVAAATERAKARQEAAAQKAAAAQQRAEERAAAAAARAKERAAAAEERAKARQEAAAQKAAEKTRRNIIAMGKSGAATFGRMTKSLFGFNSSLNKSHRGIRSFGTRLRSIVSGALIFNGISAALRKMTSYLGSAVSGTGEMKSALANLKGAAATAAAPIVQMLTPALSALANAAATVFAYISRLISTLTGKSIGSMRAAAKSMGSYGDAAGSSAKKVKDLAKANNTLGIDELNIIDQGEDEDTGGGGGAAPNYDFSGQSPFLDNLMSTIQSGDWTGAGGLLADKVNGLINGVDWNAWGSKLGTGIQAGISMISSFIEKVSWKNIGSSVARFLNSTFEKIDAAKLGRILTAKFTVAMGFLNGFIQNFDWGQFAKKLSSGIMGAFDSLSAAVAEFDWFALGQSIQEFLTNIDWGGIFSSVAQFAGSLLAGTIELFWGLLENAWNGLWGYFSQKIEEAGGNIFLGILKGIGDAIAGIGIWLKENLFDPFIDGFKNVFGIHSPSTVMADMGVLLVEGLFGGLKSVWNKITGFFSEKLTGIKDAFKGAWNSIKTTTATVFGAVKDKISEIWNKGIVGNIKGAINSILGFMNRLLQGAADMVNGMIDVLNRFHVRVPKGVPLIGGMDFGFDLSHVSAPQLPMLAKGGYVGPNQPQLVMIGDNRHEGEIVAPESKLRQAVAEGMAGLHGEEIIYLLRLILQVLQSILDKDMSVVIGDEAIHSANKRGEKKSGYQIGLNPSFG